VKAEAEVEVGVELELELELKLEVEVEELRGRRSLRQRELACLLMYEASSSGQCKQALLLHCMLTASF
jgi:hypothetical protein